MQDAAAKVAFTAYLHDLGKLAECSGTNFSAQQLNANLAKYGLSHLAENPQSCHPQPIYTAWAWDLLTQHIPHLTQGDAHSCLHESLMRHCPETFLQWIIATAERIASGGTLSDGTSHQNRLAALFEQISLDESADAKSNHAPHWYYPLKPLSPEQLFPSREAISQETAQAQYAALWQSFSAGLAEIPQSHADNWMLWLDHFDTLWQIHAQSIPAKSAAVSLYDHGKTTAALAVALWQWHQSTGKTNQDAIQALKTGSDWDEQKILLIQGDFFGIQNFIFAPGSHANKRAAKLLRGRSFQVSLFAELAALKVLEACGLPPMAQIINAAGKFMIIAPNTAEIRSAIDRVRDEMNGWFLQHTFGQVALGLTYQPASCNDFADPARLSALIRQAFAVLEAAKLQRFDLTGNAPTLLDANYHKLGECSYNQQLPAELKDNNGISLSRLAQDQITIGSLLTKQNCIMVWEDHDTIGNDDKNHTLSLPIFGYRIVFTSKDKLSRQASQTAAPGRLLRCWDFSLPTPQENLWHGCARRHVNAYIPHFTQSSDWQDDKYSGCADDDDSSEIRPDSPKTFNHIACEERQQDANGQFVGKIAIAALKGDVDNLGAIFQRGLNQPTFAKMAALSRQMNHFFSLWLPAYCHQHYPDTYTVFAGGDDFFMIGPWLQTQKLAAKMREHFARYVAENRQITFSAGIAITKPGLPLNKLSAYAESALTQAKTCTLTDGSSKNALTVYDQTVSWNDWPVLQAAGERIGDLTQAYKLSSGYLYDILHFSEDAEKASKGDVQASMWRSRFAYRTRRHILQHHKADAAAQNNAYAQLTEAFYQNGIEKLGSRYRIPLFNHFYLLRAR